MAVYKKLLLAGGGGIVTSNQQADQVRNTATILIGLGGTGVDCVRTIKTHVYNRLKADDPETDVPRYEHIRFVGIDSDPKSRGGPLMDEEKKKSSKMSQILPLDETEFFSIADANLMDALSNKMALAQRREMDWLEYEKIGVPCPAQCGKWTGGIRQIGRFMMMDRSSAFLAKVEQEINAAKRGLARPWVNVHIFSGLSGGTGSGCFLDVCYMIRSIAEKIGGIALYGYFFTPDVNLEKIPYEATIVREYITKNGYAAMQELDYCMNLPKNGGSFEQEYQGHKTIKWNAPPVDMCHLISATDWNNEVIPNAYEYVMNMTAEYVMSILTEVNNQPDLKDHLAGFKPVVFHVDKMKTIGSEIAYCAIGASCARIPLREINTYLASELFDKFGSIRINVPSKADVETLAVSSLANGETKVVTGIYDSLFRQISDGAFNQYGAYQDDWRFVRDYGNNEMVTHYTTQTAAKLNRIEANAKSMLLSDNEQSLIGRIQTQLNYILRDINRGPIYAYRMVSPAQSHNLLNIIDGLIEENRLRWEQEALQAELREADYDNAKSDFDNRRKRSLFDTDAKRFADYEFYLMALEQHKLYINIFRKLDEVLRRFRVQLVDITASYYIKLARVMETLINTFADNKEILKNPAILKADSFAVPMMTIDEIKQSLDFEIDQLNVPGLFDAFMAELLNNPDEWLTEDENKITKMVTKFFADTAFNGFANRTITSFLKDKYEYKYSGSITNEQLTNYVYDDWMLTLTEKARPLFAFNRSIWSEDQTSKLAFLSFPSISDPIKNAAEKMYHMNLLYDLKRSSLGDRILVVRIARIFPLSAYRNCSKYEEVYYSTNRPAGTHLYEGKPNSSTDFTDWNKLPPVTPQSIIRVNSVPEELKEQILEGRTLFDEACQLGVIDDEGYVYSLDEESVNEIKTVCRECEEIIAENLGSLDLALLKDAIDKLESLERPKLVRTGFCLPQDGYRETNQYYHAIMEDHFVYSPAIHKDVSETIETINALSERIQKLSEQAKKKENEITARSEIMQEYFNAVFTGIITIEGREVIYHQDKNGVITDHILSKKGENYTFAAIPVYQGFVSYRALPQKVRIEICDLANDRLSNESAELCNQVNVLKELFTSDRLAVWKEIACDFDERDEIQLFIRELNYYFDMFYAENS